MTLSFQEARTEFHDGEWEPEDDDDWEPDIAKVRGLLLQWVRDVDTIEGFDTEFNGMCLQHDLQSWIQGKLGDGAHAVIRTHDYSRAGFERVSPQKLGVEADWMYENHDEFRELADEKWVEADKDSEDVDPEKTIGSYLSGIHTNHVMADMLDINEPESEEGRYDDVEPKPERYKYFIKRYVMESDGIPAKTDTPSADELARVWVEWLKDGLGTTRSYLVFPEDDPDRMVIHDVTISDIEEWARELWHDDEMFREHLKMKWGTDTDGGDADKDSQRDLEPISRPDKDYTREKKGQMGITDY